MFAALVCRKCGRISRPEPPRRAARLCSDCVRVESVETVAMLHQSFDSILSRVPVTGRSYSGSVREVVADLKWRGRRSAARALGAELARSLLEAGVGGGAEAALRVDLVTWAPTSDPRRRRRGYDQSELVARDVARRMGLPCRRLLIRETGPTQTGLDRSRRLVNPRYRSRRLDSSVVLLVDDVVTTGATLRAAATALMRGGALDVVTAAPVATPSAFVAAESRDPARGRAGSPS